MKIFYGSKIISPKTGTKKKFLSKFFCLTGLQEKNFGKNIWSKIFCLQNHFLENRVARKNFLSKIFYVCKIISSKTGLKERKSWEKVFRKIFRRKLFMVAKSFPRKLVRRKKLWKMFENYFLVENVLWLQNHFLENRLERNKNVTNFLRDFLVENVLGLQNHFLEKRFVPKIFIANFLVKNVLWLQNHFLKNRL